MGLLNERIKEMRLKRGLTLLQLGTAIGVKEATAQRYESGEIKNIKHDTIVAIANALNCSPSYLMGWEEENETWNNVQFAMSAPEGYDALTEEGKRQIQELIKILPKKDDK